MIRLRSPVVDALGDQLLALPDGLAIGLLIAGRQLAVFTTKGGRWLRHQARVCRRRTPPASPGAPQGGLPSPADPGRCLLVRIIGNDLKPLHDAEQSLNNLRFILEHEQPLPGCEKRWLLNRISDPEVLGRLRALLDEHGCGYDVITFEAEALRAAAWDWDALPSRNFLLSRCYRWLPLDQQQAWLLALYRLKNNVLMHNNGARNGALQLARQRRDHTRPDWILPWDGNCFLTPEGWDQIRQAMAGRPGAEYFHVPMQRIASNQQLLEPVFRADPRDEPQLIFAGAAAEQFNPACPYGRRPKVELFWRLGLPGPWDDWPDEPWDQPRRPRLQPAPACPRAGWVARLQPGGGGPVDRPADRPPVRPANGAKTSRRRSLARNLAIQGTILRSLPPDPSVWQQAALAIHWQAPLEDPTLQRAFLAAAQDSACLLRSWLQWKDRVGPAPAARADQLIHALVQMVWLASLPSLPVESGAGLHEPELQRLIGLWFEPGRFGLKPRIRHRRRGPGTGQWMGLGPSPTALLFLALLSDLLLCRGGESWPAFGTWRSALMQDWQRRQEWLSLGWNGEDRRHLLLASALLHRHLGCVVESVNCLLPLLGCLADERRAAKQSVHQHSPGHHQTDLLMLLARPLGLLDPSGMNGEHADVPAVWMPLLRSPLAADQLS